MAQLLLQAGLTCKARLAIASRQLHSSGHLSLLRPIMGDPSCASESTVHNALIYRSHRVETEANARPRRGDMCNGEGVWCGRGEGGVLEAGCLVVLAVLFVRIHSADVRERLVFASDLAGLAGARIVFAALSCAGLFPEGSYAACAWGVRGVAESLLVAAVVASLMQLAGALVTRVMGREALGGGDVWLYAACCLFLDPAGVVSFLALSTAAGAVQAAGAAVRRQAAFPFAPALVWSCWAALALRMAAYATG